ncbi:uncharacterized protein [Drosophila takahashii]|uniref:uncharacterized protein n=1 Tax=Drosophila takahashii TaxID=29030 RepID=UPI001CF8A069|nr:uncharacterized protein LOC108056472 [Drosophila takahashii]
MSDAVVWDDESTIKLIRAYRNETLLWNTEHRAHSHRQERIDSWMKVATAMDMKVVEVKRKMNSLRSQLRRGSPSRRWWAPHVAFLMPPNKNQNETEAPKKSTYSENSFGSFSDEDMDDLSSDCEFLAENSRKRPYRSAFEEFRAEFEPPKLEAEIQEVDLEPMGDLTDDLVNEQASSSCKAVEGKPEEKEKKPENQEPDTTDIKDSKECDTSLYMKYVACKLAQYSPRIRSCVQFQFNRILYEADMGILGGDHKPEC